MTSKLQLTVPRVIADQYGIRPEDEPECSIQMSTFFAWLCAEWRRTGCHGLMRILGPMPNGMEFLKFFLKILTTDADMALYA